jgi:hypothetical protein
MKIIENKITDLRVKLTLKEKYTNEGKKNETQ